MYAASVPAMAPASLRATKACPVAKASLASVGSLSPTAVRTLFRQKLTRGLPDDFLLPTGPRQAEQLERPVRGRVGLGLPQPVCGKLNRIFILGTPCFGAVNL